MHVSEQPEFLLDESPDLGRTLVTGMIIIAFFFVGFMGWSISAPLESAAIAPGYVTVEQGRKTVAHLEGGIVGDILVREGQMVEKGQRLLVLSDTSAHATFELLQGRLNVARALEARLVSEYEGHEQARFPGYLLARRTDDAEVAEILSDQEQLFASRLEATANRKAILQQRIAQLSEEIAGLENQISAEDQQLVLLQEEIGMLQKMLDKGFTDKPRLLKLQRRVQEIKGKRSMHQSQIARARQSIGESELRIADIDTTRINDVAEKLRNTRADIYDLNERLRAAEDVHRRTEITAPISGMVVALQVHTPGGVIRPAQALMDIVPLDDSLVIEARVEPSDIDIVNQGMQAKVRLTAFSQRLTHPLEGQIESVSADHLVDEASGKTYYLARVAVTDTLNDMDRVNELRPGMEAEVMIVTGEHTFMDYMLEPLLRSFNRAFRET